MFVSMYAPHSIESIAESKLEQSSFQKGPQFTTRVGLWETSLNDLMFQKGRLQGLIDQVTLFYSWPKIKDRTIDSAVITGASFSIQLNEKALFSQISPWTILSLEKHLSALPSHNIFIEDSTLELWKNRNFIVLNLKGWATQNQQGLYHWTLSATDKGNKLQFSGDVDPHLGLKNFTTVIEADQLATALAIINPHIFPLNTDNASIHGKRTRIESFTQIDQGLPQDWVLLTKARAPMIQTPTLSIYSPKVTSITKGNGDFWLQSWSLARKVILKQGSSITTLDRLRLHQKQEGTILAQLESLLWEPAFTNLKSTTILKGPMLFHADRTKETSDELPSTLSLKEATLTIAPFNVSLNNITSKLSLKNPHSLQSNNLQHIEASSGTFGFLPLQTTHLELDLKTPNKTRLTRAIANALGGKLYFKGIIKTEDSLGFALAIKAEGIQMDEVAQLFPELNGLFTGTLDGEIVIRLKDDTLYFEPTQLTLTPDKQAHINYTDPGWLTRQIPEDHQDFNSFKLAEKAFEDLNVHALTLNLFQDEDYPIKAVIEGSFGSEGQEEALPLAIELNLSAPWATLNNWAEQQGLYIEFKTQGTEGIQEESKA